jgi:hypothetical protein
MRFQHDSTTHESPKDSQYRGIALGLSVVLTLLLLRKINDFDTWFHLSIGREIFHSQNIPANEFLVYMNLDQPGQFYSWGYDLLLFLIQDLGSFGALSTFNALIGSTTLLLLYLACYRATRSVHWSLLTIALLYWFISWRLSFRPETILFLALAGSIYLLERHAENPRPAWLFPLPMIALLLVQAHPTVILLLFVLIAYGLDVVWASRRDGQLQLRLAGWYSACLMGSFALALINPYGLQSVLEPVMHAMQGAVLDNLIETLTVLETGYFWLYLPLVLASAIAVCISPKRQITYLILLLVFGYLGYRYTRNLPLLAIVMCVPIARGMARLEIVCHKVLCGGRPQHADQYRFFKLLVLIIAVAIPSLIEAVSERWGLGVYSRNFPATTSETFERLAPPGRIFNFYDMGGYLGWTLAPRYRVSIDGRNYRENRALRLHDVVFRADPGWSVALDHLNVNSLFLPATLPFSGKTIPLASTLATDSDWILVAREPRAMLFMRREIHERFAEAPRLPKSAFLEQIIEEAQHTARKHPNQPGAWLSMGRAYDTMGKASAALDAYREYLARAGSDRDIQARVMYLEKNTADKGKT